MKKSLCVFACLFLMSGCVKVDDSFSKEESKEAPQVEESKQEETSDSTTSETQENTSTTAVETQVTQERGVFDSYIVATFEESEAVHPTIIEFLEDGTCLVELNVCTSVDKLNGNYKKEGNQVTLWFTDNQGHSFLDGISFHLNFIDENTLQIAEGEMFSCTGNVVEKYTIRK